MFRVDRVRVWLAARGCPPFVVDGGLEGLVAGWEKFVNELESGYPDALDEYRNDVDGRELLDGALAVASEDDRRGLSRRVRVADRRARAALVLNSRCIWGSQNAAREGWNAGRNWWYFMVPRHGNTDLARELAALT